MANSFSTFVEDSETALVELLNVGIWPTFWAIYEATQTDDKKKNALGSDRFDISASTARIRSRGMKI